MAMKWRAKAARMEEELEQTGRVVLRSRVVERGAEHAIRLLLGAALASGEILGGWSPFGVGLVACSGAGTDGLCALAGACLGYLTFRGFAGGLRYAAACVLVFSVAFAFYDVRLCQKSWFMPLTAAAMDAVTGFVYLSDGAWRVDRLVFFITEVILAGASAYFYRVAFSRWRTRREAAPLTPRQGVSLGFLLATSLISLAGVNLLWDLSLGRVLVAVLVMAAAHAGGLGPGAAAGVAGGLAMDLAAGSAPFYVLSYGFSGLLTGAGWRQGRLFGVLTYVVANAAAVLWTWDAEPRISALYEIFIASVLFVLIPKNRLEQLSALLRREEGSQAARRSLEYTRQKLAATAAAFRQVWESLRACFPPGEPNDADASIIFDRAAERVCRSCALRGTCWEHGYVNTFNALNDALPAMLERGRGEAGDFPGWFTGRCIQFPAFLKAANEEVVALLYRRQYQSRIRESRGAVCRQYEALSNALSAASAELSAELTPDPARERKLRGHLTALGLECSPAVYYDPSGHLRLEVTGEGLEVLKTPEELRRLSDLMAQPLRLAEEKEGSLVFVQAEPLMAVAGVAARRREGQTESGDTGTWFKRPDGSLFVLLCDGMGSGAAAHRESALAVRLLEEFLRSGQDSAAALRTVNSALALKNEDTGAFTTVDLLRLDLFTGAGEVCKYGAAATYVRRGETVTALTGAALPAGLSGEEGPDRTELRLESGDWVVLLSDGVVPPGEDGWVRELISGFSGDSPKDLACRIMEESESRVGAADDRTTVVLELRKR